MGEPERAEVTVKVVEVEEATGAVEEEEEAVSWVWIGGRKERAVSRTARRLMFILRWFLAVVCVVVYGGSITARVKGFGVGDNTYIELSVACFGDSC